MGRVFVELRRRWIFLRDCLDAGISRRGLLAGSARLAVTAAISSLASGLIGYAIGCISRSAETVTLTTTSYKRGVETFTVTKTVTLYTPTTVTKTVTEKPTIVIQAQLGKQYSQSAKDVEIGVKIYAEGELDDLRATYWNASTEGVLEKDDFVRKTNGYVASFLTGREPGDQYVKLEVEEDGSRAEKLLSIYAGLGSG